MHWTEHYVEHGYAVLPGLVDRAFCEAALGAIGGIINSDLPVGQWDTTNTPLLHKPFFQGGTAPEPVLDRLMEQPRLAAAIEELYGGPGHWNAERNYYIFLRPHDPKAGQHLAPSGHIDFGGQLIPILYRGFTFQLALNDTEPYSGNITVYPGTHKTVQRAVIDDPTLNLRSGCGDFAAPAPYEFVAKAGDVLFMHHLVLHSGNASHAEGGSPRVALHGEAFRDEWLPRIDPNAPNLSPWERSLAHNGYCEPAMDCEIANMQKRRDYIAQLAAENEVAA